MEKKKFFGRYPADVVKLFKNSGSRALHCFTAADGTIYATDGFIMLQLTASEYDKIIRPISKCDSGNWVISSGKRTDGGAIDCEKLFADSLKQVNRELLAKSPLCWKSGDKYLTALYATGKNSIIAANAAYVDVFAACGCLYGAGANDMIFAGLDAQALHALFMPCKKSAEFDAVAAVAFQQIPHDAERLRAECADLQRRAAEAELLVKMQEERNSALERELDELRAASAAAEARAAAAAIPASEPAAPAAAIPAAAASDPAALQDLKERIVILENANDALQARAAAAEAAAAEAEARAAEAEARAAAAEAAAAIPASAPAADPAAAIPAAASDPAAAAEAAADKFRSIPGAVVTVKGAHTAAPVVWIQGTDADAIRAAGGRWSDKKQAYYFKCA